MRLNFIFSLLSQTGPRFELTLLVLQLLSRWTRAGIIHVRAARARACDPVSGARRPRAGGYWSSRPCPG